MFDKANAPRGCDQMDGNFTPEFSVTKKWKLYSASTIKYQYCYKKQ